MTAKRKVCERRWTGRGTLTSANGETALAVTYSLAIWVTKVVPMPGDAELDGTREVKGSVELQNSVDSLKLWVEDEPMVLRLQDGEELEVTLGQGSIPGQRFDLIVNNAAALAARFPAS